MYKEEKISNSGEKIKPPVPKGYEVGTKMVNVPLKQEKMDKIKVFTAFSGIGTQEMGLKMAGVDYETVGISEIDKFAIRSYMAIHGQTKNYGDISKISPDKLPDFDLFTYSFPCQSLSVAGRLGGIEKDSGTSSSLLWECYKIIKAKRPKYLLMENVKNLVGKRFLPDFKKWIYELNKLGYKNKYAVLNSKDFGVPQNRERVFMVSGLGSLNFEFPEKRELKIRLKDILENEVDEKYYVKKEAYENLIKNLPNWNVNPSGRGINGNVNLKELADTITCNKGEGQKIVIGNINSSQDGVVHNVNGISQCLSDGHGNSPKILEIGKLDIKGNDQIKRVYDSRGVSPTITTMEGGNRQPKILELPAICASRGRNPKNPSDRVAGHPTEQKIEINKNGVSNTLTSVQKDNYVLNKDFRVRKLTSLECWRLQGISDEDFYKAAYKKEIIKLLGGENRCNAKLKGVKEKQSQENMETYVLCTTKEDISTEVLKQISKQKNLFLESKEKIQNVNIVIEKLEEVEQKECVLNITKCTENMEMLCISKKEKDRLQTVIIELGKMGKKNIEKYMKITSEENLTPKKLYTILILIEQITKLKIYGFIHQKANIHGNIAIIENYLNNLKIMKLSNLQMEYTTSRVSPSQLYKQAGNAITVNVLAAIFEKMFIDTEVRQGVLF